MKKIIYMMAALATVACAPKTTEENGQQAVEVLQKVEVIPASRKIVPQTQVYSTTVLANVTNNIASQSAGRIRKVNVEIGDFVSAGQVLAEMDKAQLEQAYLRLKNQEVELARIKGLYEEGGVSQSDYEAAVLGYDVSKTAYDNLEENTVLRSPVSGVVTARNYDSGDMYAMQSPIFTVQQITPVKVLVAVSESDYTKVSRGDKVTLEADALPGKSFTGTVIRLYPTMDAATHTFNVEVQFRNERRELRPGMFARATVNFGDNNSIVVPDASVIKQQGSGQRSVFVLGKDNTVSIKVVTLGRHFGAEFEILSGLEEGDLVVCKGQSSLKNGQKVEVTK